MQTSAGTSRDSDHFRLTPGQVIQNKWKVVDQLGCGSFGAVYTVTSTKGGNKTKYAMKIEPITNRESMLKMEIAVLRSVRSLAQASARTHVCQYYDSGESDLYRFIVMELVGKNLSELRRDRSNLRFSESTTVRLGIQCLEAIEAVHRASFIHRDVKPANCAMGIGKTSRVVYILDFGLARQYITRDGDLREPRRKAGFRGTLRYASINAHLKKDMGRHDDLWSLLYMLIEFQRGELPWTRITDEFEVGKIKKTIVADKLLEGMDPEFHRFLNELHGLQFMDVPNYASFFQHLNAIIIRKKYRLSDPFDWEDSHSKTTRTRKR